MDQREAKRQACRSAWRILSSGVGAPLDDDMTERDVERVESAWEELCQELFRRGHTELELATMRGGADEC